LRKSAPGIIVIGISAVLDLAEAIDNHPGLIEFKTHSSIKRSRLQFGCARITRAICGSVNLILVVGFIGHAHLQNSFSGTPLIQSVLRSFVASRPLRDLFL
jgi:hypothetical protein